MLIIGSASLAVKEKREKFRNAITATMMTSRDAIAINMSQTADGSSNWRDFISRKLGPGSETRVLPTAASEYTNTNVPKRERVITN